MKLLRIEIDDCFLDGFINDLEVDLEAQFGGQLKAFDVIADVETAHGQRAIFPAPHDGLHIDDRQLLKKVIGGVVEHIAHGIDGAAENALHSIDGAQIIDRKSTRLNSSH